MGNQKGFIMVWAAAASAIVLMLSAAAFFVLSSAMKRSLAMEIATDETLIAQEMLEKAKYGKRFAEGVSIPGEAVRNGRTYEVHLKENDSSVNGVSMTELTCEVSFSGEETFSMATMVERE